MLKHFSINKERDLLYPGVACFQMNVAPIAESAVGNGADEELLPSWSKFGSAPYKAKGFFTYMLQAMFEGKHSSDELNVDYQKSNVTKDRSRRIAMMFVSASTNDNLMVTGDIARGALPNTEVLVLCGHKENKIANQRVTNANAQKLVNEVIRTVPEHKDILIISNQMAARSFSIPEITELYLAFDGGDNGSTVQKMSRALTPADVDKTGCIFSLSFDPNRDDKFDALIVEPAIKNLDKGKDQNIVAALKRVLQSVDIFHCTPEGAELFSEASFIEAALERSALHRAYGKRANVDALTDDECLAIADDSVKVTVADKVTAAPKGKTFAPTDIKRTNRTAMTTDMEKVRAQIRMMTATLLEHSDLIISGTGKSNITSALSYIDEHKLHDSLFDIVGMSYETVMFLLNKGVVRVETIDLCYTATRRKESA